MSSENQSEEILGGRFAPVTAKVGFVKADQATVTAELASWQAGLGRETSVEKFGDGLADNAYRLEPLHFGSPVRTLVVQTAEPQWSAFVDNGANGSDPTSAVAVLTQRLGVAGFYIAARRSATHQLASRQIAIYGPDSDPIRKVGRMERMVAVIEEDGGRWSFHQKGDPLTSEDVEQYSARPVGRRLTSSMLADYCAALGVHPFRAGFYPGPSALVSIAPTWPQTKEPESFDQAQARLGLVTDTGWGQL